MKLAVHAVGRGEEVLPFRALGAVLHEVATLEEARRAVRAAGREGEALVVLTDEFAPAREAAGRALVVVLATSGTGAALEEVRQLVARSVGVDLLDKALQSEKRDD